MKRTTLDLVRNINENTYIPSTTENNLFELFQLDTIADLRKVSRNFLKLALILNHLDDSTAIATAETAGIVKFGLENGNAVDVKDWIKSVGGILGGYVSKVQNKELNKWYINDLTDGKIYKCIQAHSSTSFDLTKYQDISNIGISNKLENLFKNNTIKSSDGKGFKTYFKVNAQKNYIDVSDSFSSVDFALLTTWKSYNDVSNINYIVQYQKYENGKVIFNSRKFISSNGATTLSQTIHNYSNSVDETGDYGSCIALVYGTLKN